MDLIFSHVPRKPSVTGSVCGGCQTGEVLSFVPAWERGAAVAEAQGAGRALRSSCLCAVGSDTARGPPTSVSSSRFPSRSGSASWSVLCLLYRAPLSLKETREGNAEIQSIFKGFSDEVV